MPKPNANMRYTKGEEIRITEKEKYKAMAESDFLAKLKETIDSIPQYDKDGKQLVSDEALECLYFISGNLMPLNEEWKSYTGSYSHLTGSRKEMKTESESARDFFLRLDACRRKMAALEKDAIYNQEAFAHVRNQLESVHGHYQEMQFGSLNLSRYGEAKRQEADRVQQDPEVLAESLNNVYAQEIKSMWRTAEKKGWTVEGMRVEYEDRSDEPLFPHEPSPDDIMQGHLGDCYLIATLSAICAANPHLIRNLMKDNGKTVTVPVWEPDADGRFTKPPKMVTVKKTVPALSCEMKDQDGNKRGKREYLFGRTALWVQMMEKAYAASGVHKKMGKNTRSYLEIEGGNGRRALRALFGGMVRTKELMLPPDSSLMPGESRAEDLYEKVKQAVHDKDILVCSTGKRMQDPMLLAVYRRLVQEERDRYLTFQPNPAPEDLKQMMGIIRTHMADYVYHGLSLSIDEKTGDPVLGNHQYAVTGAYEENGKKYIVVRNPHGSKGQDPNAPDFLDYKQEGYSAIPEEEFPKLFDTLTLAQLAPGKLRKEYGRPFSAFVGECFDAVHNTMGFFEKCAESVRSQEFNEFYTALQDVYQQSNLTYSSDYALTKAFERLGRAAEHYLEMKGNDTEKDNARNIRCTVAKACIPLAQSYLSKDKPEQIAETQKVIAEMMTADRANYCLHKTGALPADRKPERSGDGFGKLLESLSTGRLLTIALSTEPAGIPKALAAAAARQEKADQNAQPRAEAVKEQGKQNEAPVMP